MGVLAICLVSIKGDIGIVVKNSFVSYQRITTILESFKSTMDDIRLSCKSGNNSSLGGKRIDDIYPISQPIPLVIGFYRLLYQLVNDIYIISIDLDQHSPFLALDVVEKVKEVIYTSMKGQVTFSRVEEFKIKYYYSFRRCINGMEGISTLDVPLRQIRLANDPLILYTDSNSLEGFNSILHPGEISSEVREFTRDAWETVLHFEGRIPADAKKEIKSHMKKRKLDEFFDTTYDSFRAIIDSTELEGHVIPETVTTPMADLIVDEEYNAEEAMRPLTAIQSALNALPKIQTTFTTDELAAIKPASEAVIEPFKDILTPTAVASAMEAIDDEEEAEEEIKMDEGIKMDVPGKTVHTETPSITPAVADENEEVEELNVIQLDGRVEEKLSIEQGPDNQRKKQRLNGKLYIKPIIPDGIPEGTTSAHITLTNVKDLKFKCEEGVAKIIDDGENAKTFEISLPTVNKEEATHVLTYIGPIPDQNIPCSAEALSSREGTATSSKVTVHCNECELQSTITNMEVVLSPPLLSTDENLKRTFRFKPKGSFLKKKLKAMWKDQFMEENNDYSFGAEITEPVELGDLPPTRDAEYCPCELKGKYNGIASGIRVVVPNDTDAALKCSYVKREILAECSFALSFTP